MQTVNYPIDKLIFAEYNPRQLTKDQYKDLKDSITRFGLVDPMIVNTHKQRKNILVGGHQRVRVAKDLGFEEVPCVEVKLTLDKEKELNIRLNKNTGEWDYDALANYFDVGELTDWGFTDDELQFWAEEPKEGLIDDDEVPEVEEAVTQTGDLWMLGDHKVLCGDATKKEDVERLMEGQKADMVFTDPPYNVDYDQDKSPLGKPEGSKGKIQNDNMSREEFNIFVTNWMDNVMSYAVGGIYVCMSCKEWGNIMSVFEKLGGHWSSTIIWNKNSFVMGRQDYHRKFEPILYGWKEGNKHYWCGDRKQSDVWDVDRHIKNDLHPTMKPIELMVNAISNSTIKNNNVLDPFLGSGSTLIACEKTNRKCYGMEIDPHYCDVIVKRWEEYTGKKAERTERAES